MRNTLPIFIIEVKLNWSNEETKWTRIFMVAAQNNY